MAKNIELRRRHVLLVQQGKKEEAFECLKEIWKVEAELMGKKTNEEKKEIVESVKVIEEVSEINNKFSTISDLSKIKGIGKETVKDIESIYSTIPELISALREDKKVPFRNDIVRKLKLELL